MYCSFRIFPGGRAQSNRGIKARLLLGWWEKKETEQLESLLEEELSLEEDSAPFLPACLWQVASSSFCLSRVPGSAWKTTCELIVMLLPQLQSSGVFSSVLVVCQLWAESSGYQFPLSKYHPRDWYFGQISWPVLHGHCHHWMQSLGKLHTVGSGVSLRAGSSPAGFLTWHITRTGKALREGGWSFMETFIIGQIWKVL